MNKKRGDRGKDKKPRKKEGYQNRYGIKNNNWKGGRKRRKEYFVVKAYNHPYSDTEGYVSEHRLVMEKYIGRYLKPEEIVHHIDGDGTNNKIENLVLFQNNKQHMIYHHKIWKQKGFKLGQGGYK